MMDKYLTKKFLALALLVTSLLTPTAAYAQQQTAPSALAQEAVAHGEAAPRKRVAAKPPARTARPDDLPIFEIEAEPFMRTELFFGSDREDGPDITEEEFQYFVDQKVTPLFPDGLTVLTGKGQFCCDAAGRVIQEKSFVLILLYPLVTKDRSSRKIEQIRRDYKADFQQQSVLRTDDPRPVWVSF